MSNEHFLIHYKFYLKKYKLTCRVLRDGCYYVNKNISEIRNYRNRDDIYEIDVVCLYSFSI